MLKLGNVGLVAYRWVLPGSQSAGQHCWVQSTCKVIYKNNKQDYVVCTHRFLRFQSHLLVSVFQSTLQSYNTSTLVTELIVRQQ